MRRTALLMLLLAILFGNRLTLVQDQAVCLQYDDTYASRILISRTSPIFISPNQKHTVLLWQFDNIDFRAHNFVFTSCP